VARVHKNVPNPVETMNRLPYRGGMAKRRDSADSTGRSIDSADMALRGRIGAFRLHATNDPRETTSKARATFRSSFDLLVDPEGRLPIRERARRAEAARRAHYVRIARLSAQARSRRRSKTGS
jgi:hypothetical protein